MEPLDSKPKVCFEVEKIICMSDDGNFQVQWAPAWVNKFHLVGCEHLIEEFLRNQSQIENDECKNAHLPQESSRIELSLAERTINSAVHALDGTEQQSLFLERNIKEENSYTHSSSALPFEGSMDDVEQNFESYPGTLHIKTQGAEINTENDVATPFPSMIRNDLIHHPESDQVDSETTLEISPDLASTEETPKSIEMCRVNEHIMLPSPKNGSKKYICSVCERQCPTPSLLEIHFRKHSGEKPYQCSYCGKKFSQKFSWKRHLLIHTGEKPFSCDFCTYSCARKDDLKTHLRTHDRNGDGSYICVVCSKHCRTSSQLKTHLSSHSEDTPYIQMCNM